MMFHRLLLPSPYHHSCRSSSFTTTSRHRRGRRCRLYRSQPSQSQSHVQLEQLNYHHHHHLRRRRQRLRYDDSTFGNFYRHRRHYHHRRHLALLLLVQLLLVLVCFSANERSFMLKTTVAYMATRGINNHVSLSQYHHHPLHRRYHHHHHHNNRRIRFLIPISIHSKVCIDYHTWRTTTRRRRPGVVSLMLSYSSSNDLEEATIRNAYDEWRLEYNKAEEDDEADGTSSDDVTDARNRRYENFKRNYLRLQVTNDDELREARATGQPDPIPLRLNEYADLSAEEYQSTVMMNNNNNNNDNDNKSSSSGPQSDQQKDQRQQNGESPPSPSSFLSSGSSSSAVENDDDTYDDDETERERVRTLYREWCEDNSRQYDESRLPIFTKNLRAAMESYQQKNSKTNAGGSEGEGGDSTPAPPPPRLNKYADLRPDEYRTAVMMEQQSSPEMFGSSSVGSSFAPSSSSSQQQQEQLGSDIYSNSSSNNMVPPTPLTGYTRTSSSYLEDLSSSVSSISSSNSPMTSSRRTSYASTPSNLGTVTANTGSSYLDNLSGQSSSSSSSSSYSTPFMPPPSLPTTSSTTGNTMESSEISGEARVRDVYQNWCRYYNKIPNERRLQRFADNLVILEKHFRDTGEQLTLNEYADQLGFEQRIVDDARRSAAEIEARKSDERRKQQQREEAEKRKQAEEEQKRKAELAKKYEEDRRRAEEVRLQAERKQAELARLEALRKQAEEAQQLEEQRQLEKMLYEERRREEASSLQSALVDEIAVPTTSTAPSTNEETLSESKGAILESDEEIEEEPEPIILPRNSYMDAVAKTWVDRSAYLKALQQGKSMSVLPDNTDEEPVRPVQSKIQKRSTQSLVDAMWKVMENPTLSTTETQNGSGDINEEIVSDLIKEADEMIADARRSSTISKQQLQNLKDAVDALRRRNEDERAAEEARAKAQEWKDIQVGLEKEARRAREVREYEERTAAEAREKARSVESAGSNVPSDLEAQSNPFANFFSSIQKDQMPGMTNSPLTFWGSPTPSTDVEETPTVKSLTKPVVFRIQDSWLDRVFGFFGGKETQEEEELGQGTITLEAAKRKSVFDIFVSSDVLEPKQPPRGSIIMGEPEKPSILSFFANLGKSSQVDAEGNGQGASMNPFASFFGDTKAIAAEVDPERLRKVENYESRRRFREDKVAWLEDQRSRILEQSDRKLSRKEARRLQREIDDLAVSSLSASAAVDQDIPQLAKWSKTPDQRITGYVSQSTSKYRRGTKITTNRVKGQVIKAGLIITTVSGSQYRLLMPLSNQYVDSLGQSAAASSSSASKLQRQQQPQQQQQETKTKQSSFQPLGSFIGGLFPNGDGGVGSSSIPTLVEWIQNEDGTLTGFVNNKEGFDDGTVITTSPVRRGVRPGMVVQTGGGSKYRLLKQGKKRERQ